MPYTHTHSYHLSLQQQPGPPGWGPSPTSGTSTKPACGHMTRFAVRRGLGFRWFGMAFKFQATLHYFPLKPELYADALLGGLTEAAGNQRLMWSGCVRLAE